MSIFTNACEAYLNRKNTKIPNLKNTLCKSRKELLQSQNNVSAYLGKNFNSFWIYNKNGNKFLFLIVPLKQSCFCFPLKLDLNNADTFTVGREVTCSLVLQNTDVELEDDIQHTNISRQG